MITKMRAAGKIVANIHNKLSGFIKPGITTNDIDLFCHQQILLTGAKPGIPANYNFPKIVCTSVNDEVCHGIPSDRTLKENDIISVDIVAEYNGYYGDSCVTYSIGQKHKILHIAYETMWNAIMEIKNDIHIGTLGYLMQSYAQKNNCHVIREFCGHGIGTSMHEAPQIPFFGVKNSGIKLKSGMFITIEPMVTLGNPKIQILKDGWTAKSLDNKLSAQFEHTIAILDNGYEVMTFNDFDEENQKIRKYIAD